MHVPERRLDPPEHGPRAPCRVASARACSERPLAPPRTAPSADSASPPSRRRAAERPAALIGSPARSSLEPRVDAICSAVSGRRSSSAISARAAQSWRSPSVGAGFHGPLVSSRHGCRGAQPRAPHDPAPRSLRAGSRSGRAPPRAAPRSTDPHPGSEYAARSREPTPDAGARCQAQQVERQGAENPERAGHPLQVRERLCL